jgi:FkbM family methyltransferase
MSSETQRLNIRFERFKRTEEYDRLVALYESVVGRTALLEQKIDSMRLLEEQVRNIGADHTKLTKLYEDANSRAVEIEQQLRTSSPYDNQGRRPVATFGPTNALAARGAIMISRVVSFPSRAARWLKGRMSSGTQRLNIRFERFKRTEEYDRLVALYESVVGRTALLEQKIDSMRLLEEQVRNIGADHAKLTKLYDDANSRAVEIEQQLRNIGNRSSDVELLWSALRAELSDLIEPDDDQGTPALDSLIKRVRTLSNQLIAQCRLDKVAIEFLKHDQRRLRDKLQQAMRSSPPDSPFPKLSVEPSSYLPLHLIDVGSQPLVSEDHVYSALKRSGACVITGFEAQADKNPPDEPNVRILTAMVGAGGPAVFHLAHFDPTSSLLEANLPFLRQFIALADMCKAVSKYPVQTTRLDDVLDILDCDFLKLDVQGGELDVLRGADRLLERAIVVHTEVEFSPVYCDQPLFSDIDIYLRAKGFELMDLVKPGHNTYAELPSCRAASRLLWSDAIYFRTVDALSKLGAQKLLRAAYIAHVNYGMWDLAAHILTRYDSRYRSNLATEYVAAVEAT